MRRPNPSWRRLAVRMGGLAWDGWARHLRKVSNKTLMRAYVEIGKTPSYPGTIYRELPASEPAELWSFVRSMLYAMTTAISTELHRRGFVRRFDWQNCCGTEEWITRGQSRAEERAWRIAKKEHKKGAKSQ